MEVCPHLQKMNLKSCKNLIENDLVECIVALPSQMFYNTQIPACLWFVTKSKAKKMNAIIKVKFYLLMPEMKDLWLIEQQKSLAKKI